MRIAKYVVVGAALLALMPATASAQRPVHVNFGGGPTFLFGDLGDRFGTGWGPAIGVSVGSGRLEGQFEYAYRWFDVKDELPINATRFSANHHMHQLDFNLRANLSPRDAAVRPYAIVGPGVYHRTVEITEYEGTGIICDPYWYVCGAYPISSVVGSRSSWDWGFNIGGGVGFGLGEEAEFYIEMRYHYTGGPEFTPPAGVPGTGGTATGNYLPLTFGFRF